MTWPVIVSKLQGPNLVHETGVYCSQVAIQLGLSVLDLGVNAAAATAAAAAGAHFNHDAITTRVLCLGAVAGAMKSGFLNAAVVLKLTATNIFVQAVIIIVASPFGSAILVTSAIAGKSMGNGMWSAFVPFGPRLTRPRLSAKRTADSRGRCRRSADCEYGGNACV
jgi:hypothetical protein